jgi:hypothetical protein
MIHVKQAVQIAAKYLSEIINQPIAGLLVEETEKSSDDAMWFITVSYYLTSDMFGSRSYKIIAVDAETGDVKSMKIRTINGK